MPAITPAARELVADGRLTTADVDRLERLVREGGATVKDVELIAKNYVDAFDAGVGTRMRDLLRAVGGRAEIQNPISNLAAQPGLLNGLLKLSKDMSSTHPAVKTVQKALMALSNRLETAGWTLPKYGADGSFGTEMESAVIAFRASKGLPDKGGLVDLDMARALDAALRATNVPPVFAPGAGPNGQSMVKAAEMIVRDHAEHYGVDDPWFNLDPKHALPANRELNGIRGKWKCNLFACNVVYAAGFEPPYYGNRGGGEYPNANQLFKWSDKYARQYGNKAHFQLVDELHIQEMEGVATPDRVRERLTQLLLRTQPGDLIIVDHRGDEVADGGHCRVALTNGMAQDGTGLIPCAQASFDAAAIKQEDLSRFTGEEKIWILRPNKPRRVDA